MLQPRACQPLGPLLRGLPLLLLLLLPTLVAAQGSSPAEPKVEAFSPEINPDSLVFSDIEDLAASGDAANASFGTDGSGLAPGSLADVPTDVLPAELLAPGSGPAGPSAAGPGRGSGARNSSKGPISSLNSLLAPPPPGSPPYNLTPEQQAAIPELRTWRQGSATVTYNRAVGNLDGANMNCGLGYLSDYFKDHWVAVPSAVYRTGELCGACVRMACLDSVCRDALVRRDVFMIVDSCKDCQANNLIVSARGYANLTGLNYDLNPMTVVAWEFVSCAPLIQGGIKMLPSNQNRQNYLGLNFSNTKALLRAVIINNLALSRTSFGYWVLDTKEQNIPLRPPFNLQLVGVNGQRLTKQLASFRAQDLGIQFDG